MPRHIKVSVSFELFGVLGMYNFAYITVIKLAIEKLTFLASVATKSIILNCYIPPYEAEIWMILAKEIKMILRLFLVIAMYCQGSSSQIKSITQPLPLLAGWEGSLGTCSR